MKRVEIRMFFAMVSLDCAMFAASARACSCAAPPEVAEALASADAVFLGEVTSQAPDGSATSTSRRINVAVLRSWKGVIGDQVGIVTAPASLCGISSNVGDQLVFYAEATEGDALRVSVCSRTGLMAASLDDTAELDLLADALELSDGPDPLYPPFALQDGLGPNRDSARSGAPCGLGVIGAALSLCALFLARIFSS